MLNVVNQLDGIYGTVYAYQVGNTPPYLTAKYTEDLPRGSVVLRKGIRYEK